MWKATVVGIDVRPTQRSYKLPKPETCKIMGEQGFHIEGAGVFVKPQQIWLTLLVNLVETKKTEIKINAYKEIRRWATEKVERDYNTKKISIEIYGRLNELLRDCNSLDDFFIKSFKKEVEKGNLEIMFLDTLECKICSDIQNYTGTTELNDLEE